MEEGGVEGDSNERCFKIKTSGGGSDLVLDGSQHDLVPVGGGLVHVPVVADVRDGAARARIAPAPLPPPSQTHTVLPVP